MYVYVYVYTYTCERQPVHKTDTRLRTMRRETIRERDHHLFPRGRRQMNATVAPPKDDTSV